MKRILTLLVLISLVIPAYAQCSTDNLSKNESISLGLKYKQLKSIYNYRYYYPTPNDTYSPLLMGLASAFIPGLGECLTDEWGRGLFKITSSVVLDITFAASLFMIPFEHERFLFGGIAMGSAVAISALWVWGIGDAIKVAKVKNMYLRDVRKQYGIDLDFTPQVGISPYDGHSPMLGMRVALSF